MVNTALIPEINCCKSGHFYVLYIGTKNVKINTNESHGGAIVEKKIDLKEIEGILDELKDVKGSLITILQKTQDIYGYLPKEAIEYISLKTGIKTSEIMGVATFYTQFRLTPVGKYLIMLCQGTACHVNSSELILQTITEELGITDGETTPDGLFSLKCVACLGCCSLSPVMMINENTYGSLTPEKTRAVIKQLREAE